MGTGWRRAFCTTISRDPAETTSAAAASSSSSSILEHKHQQQQQSPIPSSRRSYVKLGIGGIFSSGSGGGGGSSNPSTPRLHSTNSNPRCRTTTPSPPAFESEGPRVVQCKTTTTKLPSADADAVAVAATTPSSLSSSSSIKSNNSKGSLSPRLFQSSSPRSPSRFALLKTALRLSRNRCGICGESVKTGDQRTAVFTAECSHAFHFPCISSHVRTQGSLVCPVCSATWHDVPFLSSSLHLPSAAAAAAGQFLGSRERRSNNTRGGRCWQGEMERAAPAAGTTKIYDDDESLQLSPTNRIGVGVLQFNPIPEELEAEGDDDEGQGQGEDDCEQGHQSDRIHQIISVVPDSMAMVSNGRNHLNYVASIRVKAPRLPPRPQAAAAATSVKKHDIAASIAIPPSLLDHPSCRAPIDLVTVLDVSGSMTVAKLQMLKRAMRLVISSLGPGDRLSIVAFSMASAKRLFPLRRMSRLGQRSSRQIVDRLVICGSSQVQAQGQDQSHHCLSKSCMGDALRKATKVLEDRRERNPVAMIMLLSDGHSHSHGHGQDQQQEQNTHGTCITSSSRSQSQQPSSATRFTHIEIPIHTSGGQKQGTSLKYNNVPVEEENAFAKDINGLVSVVLQDVHLQFSFPCASGAISSVYSYPHGGECGDICGIGQAMSHRDGGKSVFLGDLYAGEEMQLLVELKVPKATVVGGHAITISLKCSYRDPLTREVIHCGERSLSMPMPLHSQEFPILLRSSSSSSSRAGATSMTTQQQQQQLQLRNVFVTTRAMAESRRLVELSDLDTALHLLSSARSLLLQQSAAVSNTHRKLVLSLEAQLEDLQKQQQQKQKQQQRRWQPQPQSVSPSQRRTSEQPLLAESRGGGEPLTPTSAWRAAEQLAKVAIMRKSLNRVSDLHGLENARF